jgi:hypothetical protein
MKNQELINKIEKIILTHGAFTTADVEANSSPVIQSLGSTHLLAEQFWQHKVTAVLYVNDMETNEEYIFYEDLSEDVLEEILFLCEQWEADELQTEKRIQTNY